MARVLRFETLVITASGHVYKLLGECAGNDPDKVPFVKADKERMDPEATSGACQCTSNFEVDASCQAPAGSATAAAVVRHVPIHETIMSRYVPKSIGGESSLPGLVRRSHTPEL